MRYSVLAVDYDGTLARDGIVPDEAVAALQRLRASGRRAVLVTGRHLDDIRSIFGAVQLFDVVVLENGALLWGPRADRVELLGPPPDGRLVEALRQRDVEPLHLGHGVIATSERNRDVVQGAIDELDLDLLTIPNKGALMVLPPGVDKASGLLAALKELGTSAASTVAIGDADNDMALLSVAALAVAVANAEPQVKAAADLVTAGGFADGVIELIDALIRDDLASALDGRAGRGFALTMESVRFAGQIRYWNPERASGLAVVDIPPGAALALGGLKQQRVRGILGGTEFTSSVMPAGGGRLALSVSKAMMSAARAGVGDAIEIEITDVGRG
jgi:hydroxymethylpyrimidine pyrophosphatase-like HAD family hydrolase